MTTAAVYTGVGHGIEELTREFCTAPRWRVTVSGWNDDANTTAPRLATGVKAALGHTDLDREALAGAVAAGATLSTHLGNGAHDMLQRHNNYLWYQLASRDMYASFISGRGYEESP